MCARTGCGYASTKHCSITHPFRIGPSPRDHTSHSASGYHVFGLRDILAAQHVANLRQQGFLYFAFSACLQSLLTPNISRCYESLKYCTIQAVWEFVIPSTVQSTSSWFVSPNAEILKIPGTTRAKFSSLLVTASRLRMAANSNKGVNLK